MTCSYHYILYMYEKNHIELYLSHCVVTRREVHRAVSRGLLHIRYSKWPFNMINLQRNKRQKMFRTHIHTEPSIEPKTWGIPLKPVLAIGLRWHTLKLKTLLMAWLNIIWFDAVWSFQWLTLLKSWNGKTDVFFNPSLDQVPNDDPILAQALTSEQL